MPRGKSKLPDERRDVTLKVRVTREEAARCMKEADKHGLTLSAWIRLLVKQAIGGGH